MKRTMKKLTAMIMAGVLLISGGYFEPGKEIVHAEDVNGKQLEVDYRVAHGSLQAAAQEAMAATSPEDYSGIKVSGTNVLTGFDFAYLNTAWKHASTIDLGDICAKGNAMGMDYMEKNEDTDESIEGTEQSIGSTYMMPSSSEAPQVKTLILPSDLQLFNQGALASLPNLEEVEIPLSVTEVGFGALCNLPALKKVSYHGTGLTSIDNYIFYSCNSAVTLDFSGAAGLETVTMGSGVSIADFDFTGCTSLNNVNLGGQILDFSGGPHKEWLDSFEGTVTVDRQKPTLTFAADPVEPLELNSEFPGPPVLKGLLLDGTDLLAADAEIPDWINSRYIGFFKDTSRVSVHYINPYNTETDTVDTSVGGIHTIRWDFKYMQNPMLNYTSFEIPVEVKVPEDLKRDTVFVKPDTTPAAGEEVGTEANPMPNLLSALSYLKDGGTLHLLGDATLPKGIRLPSNLTICGSETGEKPVLTLSDDLMLSSDLNVDGVQLKATEAVSLYANGHTLTFGEHMAGTDGKVSIYGGGKGAVERDTSLVLNGGTFADVYAGSYIGGGHGDDVSADGSVTGNTDIQIGGSVEIENVYGGGNLAGAPGLRGASVNVGNTRIVMTGGTVKTLYGGGFSKSDGSADAGDTHLTISGGTVETLYGGGYVEYYGGDSTAKVKNTEILLNGDANVKTVYGGGYAGLGDNADVTGNVKLTICGNASVRTVYGGGYVFSNRNAYARVCGNVDIFYQGGSTVGEKCIYGAGKYAEYENYEPVENACVEGNVTIHAEGGSLEDMSLGGKGPNGGNVNGTASILIRNYEEPQRVSTLFHFDNLVLDNSRIIFPMNRTPNLSCDGNDGCNIEMKNGSSMVLEHSVSDTFSINNLTARDEAAITLYVNDDDRLNGDNAIPLTVNGKITVSQPITLTLAEPEHGSTPKPGDQVFVTSNAEGNDTLVSRSFSLQNEDFRLIKKNGALILVSASSTEEEQQDPPRALEGVAPSGYGKADGEISGITEEMEYASSPDAPPEAWDPWKAGDRFAAGTYYVRYAANEEKRLLASGAVEVVVPDGQHSITYHLENAELAGDAPRTVANGGSFTFQCNINAGYQLDLPQCSVTGGTLTCEDQRFTVENVTEDVTVNIIATEIPGMVKITKQPHDVTVRAGHSAVFEIAAEGDPEISYQWWADKGRGFSAIAGETAPTLTTEVTEESADKNKYYCVVSNHYGSVTSKTVTLQVLAAGETIVAQEQDNAIEGITVQTHAAIGDSLPFTARGAGMENTQPAQGDIRFVPLFWTTAMDNGEWANAPYTAAIRTNRFSQGQQTLSVTFLQQRYNGTEWETTGVEAIKTVTFQLEKKEKPGNHGSEDEKPGNHGSEDEKPGNHGSEDEEPGNHGSEDGKPGNHGSEDGKPGNHGSEDGKPDENVPDDEPKTGDRTSVELYATMAMIFGFSYFAFWMEDNGKITEQRKKKLINRLIAWAKKGGRLRRAIAIAAIFVVLAYSHTIGKCKSTKVNRKTLA